MSTQLLICSKEGYFANIDVENLKKHKITHFEVASEEAYVWGGDSWVNNGNPHECESIREAKKEAKKANLVRSFLKEAYIVAVEKRDDDDEDDN